MQGSLTVRTGDLLESQAQTLVNTVNTVGVMGKGIALAFKNRFPRMFDDYVRRCKAGKVKLGQPYLYTELNSQWILNFPTKEHWRSVADLASIEKGLEYLLSHYSGWGISSIAVPPLGCGLGGLDWEIVGPRLVSYLVKLDIPVELYAPNGTPLGQLNMDFLLNQSHLSEDHAARLGNRIPEGWIALIEILSRITNQKYHWPIGRTTFEKISYFATMAGIDTGLEFRQGSFGPHSSQYAGMRAKLISNGLLREELLGRMHQQLPGPTYDKSAINNYGQIIERVADLFTRIQSTKESELVASSHFASHILHNQLGRQPTELEVFSYVREWKARRREGPYPDADIANAIRDLAVLGWLDVKGSMELPVAA